METKKTHNELISLLKIEKIIMSANYMTRYFLSKGTLQYNKAFNDQGGFS